MNYTDKTRNPEKGFERQKASCQTFIWFRKLFKAKLLTVHELEAHIMANGRLQEFSSLVTPSISALGGLYLYSKKQQRYLKISLNWQSRYKEEYVLGAIL